MASKLPKRLAKYQANADLFQQYCTTHQNLIWGVSIVSGISAGWASYVSRTYHQHKIEQKVKEVTDKLSDIERQRVRNKYWWRVTVPLCISCCAIGYGVGRLHSSWKSYKHMNVWKDQLMNNIDAQLQKSSNYALISDTMNKIRIQQHKQLQAAETSLDEASKFNPRNWLRK
eukprot:CAMPEP_0197031548 /NCGR_PEP_ID=MMETSP1384-20130603/10527_1 /TAXON_ID=29189 /ORGANISM="Ammonia sp." /LENGTH=171 /DNA_ID=CAMNT_0042461091 /DNA_START=21 /DNA_END=536 /DNA_ORIENTATION=+